MQPYGLTDWGKDLPFDNYFPYLMSKIKNLKNELHLPREFYLGERMENQRKYFVQYYPEIEKAIPKWKWLKDQANCAICCHILRMFYCLLVDEYYSPLPEKEKNILKWVVILHDIAKRGDPLIPFGARDYTHPYTSAIEVLNTFLALYDIKGIPKKVQENIKFIQDKLKAGIIDDEYTDLSILDIVLKKAEETFGGKSFCFLVFKLVLMHQALQTIKEFYQPTELSNDEICKYCDLDFLKLLKIIMIIDSLNYNLGSPEKMAYYRGQFEKLLSKYFEMVSPKNETQKE